METEDFNILSNDDKIKYLKKQVDDLTKINIRLLT